MLAALSAICDGRKLFGLDLDERKQNVLKAIPRFERLYTTPSEQLPGKFGTSISATWLAGGLGEAVGVFVDEDSARTGGAHFGRAILKPEQVPAESIVYLAFAPEISIAISQRLSGLPATFITPPMAAA